MSLGRLEEPQKGLKPKISILGVGDGGRGGAWKVVGFTRPAADGGVQRNVESRSRTSVRKRSVVPAADHGSCPGV